MIIYLKNYSVIIVKNYQMKDYYDSELMEAGIDEVARGCLAGPVYSAAVIWPKEVDDSDNQPIIKDSKN